MATSAHVEVDAQSPRAKAQRLLATDDSQQAMACALVSIADDLAQIAADLRDMRRQGRRG